MSAISDSRDGSNVEKQATVTTKTKATAVFSAGQLLGVVVATVSLNAYLLVVRVSRRLRSMSAWIILGHTFGEFMVR